MSNIQALISHISILNFNHSYYYYYYYYYFQSIKHIPYRINAN